MKPGDAIENIVSRAGVVRVRNALNPLLWMTALVFPTAIAGAYLFRDDTIIKFAPSIFAVTPVAATITAYFMLLFRDPDRLQSEEYLLRHEALQILHKQGDVREVLDVSTEKRDLRIEEQPGEGL